MILALHGEVAEVVVGALVRDDSENVVVPAEVQPLGGAQDAAVLHQLVVRAPLVDNLSRAVEVGLLGVGDVPRDDYGRRVHDRGKKPAESAKIFGPPRVVEL